MPFRSDRSTPAPIVVLLALCCVSATGLSAEPIIVRVRAYVCSDGLRTCRKPVQQAFAPADVVVEAFVPSHPDNWRVRIGLSCSDLGDLNEEPSERELRPDQAVYRWERRDVTFPCAYVGYALVDSTRRTRGSDTSDTPVVILSPHE